jgi:hypothetical protein
VIPALRIFRAIAPYVLVAVVALYLWDRLTRRPAPDPDPALQAAIEAKARELNAVTAQLVAEKQISSELNEKLADYYVQMKKSVPSTEPLGILKTTVSIEDKGQGTSSEPVAQKFIWKDNYNRFFVMFPSGEYLRRQKFHVDVLATIADGQAVVTKVDFKEFDPETGDEIPADGITHTGSLKVRNLVAMVPPAPPFKPRLIAAIDHRGAFGAGAELVNFKDKLNAGLVALYDGSEEEIRGGGFIGLRLFDSNVSPAAYGALSSDGGGFKFGALVAIELTR